MKIEEKTILWKPVSEYTGGRVLATNGLDILIGELNPEGDCVSEDCSGTHLCGITHFAKIDGFFPTLRESEDEKIRKTLIDYFDDANKADENPLQSYGIHTDKAIAWLEKQGEQKPTLEDAAKAFLEALSETPYNNTPIVEAQIITKQLLIFLSAPKSYNPDAINEQKPADKVEPKFHEGDWIIHQGTENIYQVVARIDNQYQLKYGDNYTIQKCADVDRCARFWTIQDAKDGDVLACPPQKGYEAGEQVFIFKGINSRDYVDNCIEYYCRICEGVFYENKNGYMGTTSTPLYPATKEQRDTLMKAMTDAGYTFNFEKKELKKIEQKSTWSEEDERMYKSIIYSFNHNYPLTIQQQEFVKSIKPQPKQKWSEEDEKMFSELLSSLLINASDQWVKYGKWLKTLKERITWKPTEPQLVSLTIACDRKDRVGFELTQLLKELKKL